jgi:hypothetical protein
MNADALVDDYIRLLELEAARLPTAQRVDLIAEVRGHIELALAEAGTRNEATVRTVLDRLGSPTSIVDADSGVAEGSAAGTARERRGWGPLEVIAALLMTVGILALPLIGPLVGLVLAWASSYWTVRVKIAWTVLVILLIAVPVLGLLAARSGSDVTFGTGTPVPPVVASG